MIRIVCFDVDAGMAANVGGPVTTQYRTFDVELPELEAWLNEPKRLNLGYTNRGISGIELLADAPSGAEKE